MGNMEHAIEQVANALHGDQCAEDPDLGERCNCGADDFYRQAEIALDTLREAGLLAPVPLQEVAAPEELDRLPAGSVVADKFDRAWTLYRHDWSCVDRRVGAMFLPHDFLPVKVVHVPAGRAEGDGRADQ